MEPTFERPRSVRSTVERPPLSAANDGALVACRNCDAKNDGERRFCKACGSPLHGPCPECGETVGLSEKFCGGCGFSIGETFDARLAAAAVVLAEGSALRAAAQFTQARTVLARVAADQDALLHTLRRRAEHELKQCATELAEAESRRGVLLATALQAMEQSAYERAVALLEQIPEGVRNEDVQQLWGRAKAFRDEAERLLKTIREGLATKQYLGLLAHVERLLVLKPNHQQARDMIDKLRTIEVRGQQQVRERNLGAAKRKIAECKFDEAVSLLEEIETAQRDAEVAKALEFARETAWLARQLRSNLNATETLTRLGERLLKLQPADLASAKLLDQLKQRRAVAAPPRFAVLVRPLPAESTVGCPLEYPAPWKQLRMDAAIAPQLAPRAEQFFAAAGLALEGLGKAALTPKFALEQGSSLLRRLGLGGRKREARTAWGIDLGACTLKAIRLRAAEDGTVTADAAEYLTLESPLTQPGVDPAAIVRNAWQRLAAKHDLSTGPLCCNIAGQSLLSRSFKLPPVDDKKLPDLLKNEAPRQFPVPIDTIACDHHIFSGPDPNSRYDREAALFAIKRQSLADRLALFDAAGARPDFLQADSLATYNCLAFEKLWPSVGNGDSSDDLEEEVTMALDIGADSTDAIVGHQRSVWTRVIPCGGNEFTRALVKELTLTFADAERRKRQPFAAPAAHGVDRAMQSAMRTFVAELQRTMTYYGTHQRRRRISRIVLLGGGARLHGLFEALWQGH